MLNRVGVFYIIYLNDHKVKYRCRDTNVRELSLIKIGITTITINGRASIDFNWSKVDGDSIFSVANDYAMFSLCWNQM